MWFLIKAAFWFTLVLLILPFAKPDMAPNTGHEPDVQVGATIAAATSAFDDLTGICQRRPDVCKTGGETLAALGLRARDGALIAYQLLNEHFSGAEAPDPGATAATTAAATEPAAPAMADATSPGALTTAGIPVPTPSPKAETQPSATSAGDAVLPKPYLPPAR